MNILDLIQHTKFEKVSFNQFLQDWIKTFPEEYDESNEDDIDEIKQIYNSIKLPTRGTKKSAGYDFKAPINFYVKPDSDILIPTGIRCKMPDDMVLMIYPRSSLGFKYRLGLANTTAVVDADYYNADNEGHIFIKLVNDGDMRVKIDQGQAFCQGILMRYATTDDDFVTEKRKGGMGSTDKSADKKAQTPECKGAEIIKIWEDYYNSKDSLDPSYTENTHLAPRPAFI